MRVKKKSTLLEPDGIEWGVLHFHRRIHLSRKGFCNLKQVCERLKSLARVYGLFLPYIPVIKDVAKMIQHDVGC